MRIEELLAVLKRAPLIASVQADSETPLDDPQILLRLARASMHEGVQVLRLQGTENIRTIRAATDVPIIGLIKRKYDGSEVYITPTSSEVDELLDLDCEVVALDATERVRPEGARLDALVNRIHAAGRLAMADCDTAASILYALKCGADLIGTTLSGYTPDSNPTQGPDFRLLEEAVASGKPAIAEGRYADPWQAEAAMLMGAAGVVVGGALNDPIKQTARFKMAVDRYEGPVGAVDIGGTWMRYALFDDDRRIVRREQVATLKTFDERLEWIRSQAAFDGVSRLGIGTGGTVHPGSTIIVESKPTIPDNERHMFLPLQIGGCVERVVALNDGLATAWGHYCHPRFAGRRVATLALGTGVGFGLVDRGQILMGTQGGYPRLNDVPTVLGETFEELLGGAALTKDPDDHQKSRAMEAGRCAVQLIQNLYFPDVIVVCGGVGLSDWLDLGLPKSPYGADAGLFGAEALVRYRPF